VVANHGGFDLQSLRAFQAADSDPTNDKAEAMTLCAQLFDSVGWKVDEHDRVICSDCQPSR